MHRAVPEWCSSCDMRCAPLHNIFLSPAPLVYVTLEALPTPTPLCLFPPPQQQNIRSSATSLHLLCTIVLNPSLLPGPFILYQ